MSRERYLVSSYGDNREGTRQGILKFFELCQKLGSGVIVVPTIGNVDGTLLTDVLTPAISKALIEHRTVQIGNGKTISLCGSATLKKYTGATVYLALWGTKDMIEKIEADCSSFTAVVLVTWVPEDAQQWVRAYKVTTIYHDGVVSSPKI